MPGSGSRRLDVGGELAHWQSAHGLWQATAAARDRSLGGVGPLLVPGGPEYRNLALRRAAYQSSSYDDNLTAQLVTDGIRQAQLPRWLATATSERGIARKVERELHVDGNVVSTVTLERPPAWVELELAGIRREVEVAGIRSEVEVADARGEPPRVTLGGYNVVPRP